MLGIGPRLNTVFKSRWRALGWAGCILMLAYCSVPAVDQALPADTKAAPPPHRSPWAY